MKVGESLQTSASKCINCGKLLDGVSAVGDDVSGRPEPGDFSICIECGTIMVFGDDLQLRAPNKEEAHAIAGDQRVLAIQRARGTLKESDNDDED